MIAQGQEAADLFVAAVNQMYGSQVQPTKAGTKRMWSVMLKESTTDAPNRIMLSNPHDNKAILEEKIEALRSSTDPDAELTFNVVRHANEGGKIVMQSMCMSLQKNAEGEMVLGINGLEGPLLNSKPGMTVVDINALQHTDIDYAGSVADRTKLVLQNVRGFINGRTFNEAFPLQTYPRFERAAKTAKPN